ncbi:MAG TPA: SDR family oxidoreductase [Chloroflexota bacterium]|nr:SDR family oxidoreductase [Chloroflexota bacterium]
MLTGKVALVTGSARGIGAACALALAEAGADIVINDVAHLDDAEALHRRIAALGRQVAVHQADVADRGAVEAMVAGTVQHFGRLDIAVANAYRSIRQPFLEVTEEAMAATFAVTYWGVFHTLQLAARAMVAGGNGGRLIVISSIHAEQPFARSTAYNAAKAAAVHMARTAANELAPHHITVNCIAPGWIDTPGERAYSSEAEIAAAGRTLPWGRLGQPGEIGALAAFLASEEAEFISGAFIRADGAQMVRLGS